MLISLRPENNKKIWQIQQTGHRSTMRPETSDKIRVYLAIQIPRYTKINLTSDEDSQHLLLLDAWPLKLLLWNSYLDKFVEDANLGYCQAAVVAVVCRQQAPVQGEPLLAEILAHHLRKLEENMIRVPHQLLEIILSLKQQGRFCHLDAETVFQGSHRPFEFHLRKRHNTRVCSLIF